MSSIGIYIHVPFCKRKCAYCDFFSVCSLKAADGFTSAVLKDMERFRKKGIKADSLYLGGGTPTELGKQRLCGIIERARDIFDIDRSAEITVETNPQTAEGDAPKVRVRRPARGTVMDRGGGSVSISTTMLSSAS